jgi:ATP-dependent Clp protease adaptor protein ClpS
MNTRIRFDEETSILEKEKIKEPNRYCIVFFNDDFTTQEFVVHVLERFLYKSYEEAFILMLKVHKEGKAKVGSFIKDIAETKVEHITEYSRKNGMPLLVVLDKE